MNLQNLPEALKTHQEKLEESVLPFIRLKALKNTPEHLWESKVGGMPYLPKTTAWPTNPSGKELFFLIQINFAEMPPLEPFPEKGILSFFINDDDLYGMDFDDGEVQDTFRVLWFPEPILDEKQLKNDLNMFRPYEYLPHQPEQAFALKFEQAEMPVPTTDYQFWTRFGTDFFQQFGSKEWDIMDEYAKGFSAQGHRIGGYAYFTQDDPRNDSDPMLLLLQLDSDELMDLMWGDMGVGHFFIRAKDLEKCDFSKVLYDWDNL